MVSNRSHSEACVGRRSFWWLLGALSLAACGGSGGSGGGASNPDAGDGEVSVPEAGLDARPSADAAAMDGGGRADAGADAASGEDGGEPVPAEGVASPGLHVWVDRPLLEQADETLTELTVRCSLRDDAGRVQVPPADLEITVDAPDATEVRSSLGEAVFTFPEAGSFHAVCRSMSLEMEASESFEVAFEGIDRDVLRLAARAAAAQQALQAALDAAVAGDAGALSAAAGALRAVADRVDPSRLAGGSYLVDISPDRWPTADDARAAGMEAGPQDADWLTGCMRVRAALGALGDAVDALPDPAGSGPLAEAAVAGYAAASEDLRAAVAAWEGLEPSPPGWLQGLDCLDGLVTVDLPRALAAELSWHASALAAADLPGPGSGAFTFIGTMIANTARSIYDTYAYQSLLKAAARRALYNAALLAAADLFNRYLPAGTGAPEITSVHGSAAGFVVPGNPFYAVGAGFDPRPEGNYVIFVYPDLGSEVRDAIDGALGACQLPELGRSRLLNALKMAKAVKECIDGVEQAAMDVGALADKVVLEPASVDGDLGALYFSALPTGVHTMDRLGIPATGVLIPVRRRVGHGPAIAVNVIAE